MTPEQWVALRIAEEQRHCAEMGRINGLWERLSFPDLADLRPCLADDIKVGAVIYYPETDKRCRYWAAVHSLLHYGDDFKAYTAESGCRYGLAGAFVRKEPPHA